MDRGRVIVVREYGHIAIGEVPGASQITAAEAETILRICRDAGKPIALRGHRRLVFANWCGVVQAGGLTIEVLPKIAEDDAYDRGTLLRMLAVAHDFPLQRLEQAKLDQQRHTLLQWVVRWFCDELFEQLHRGILRQYVEISELIPTIRGKWRPERDALRTFMVDARFDCQFDDLTVDNRLNRILKAALAVASRLPLSKELSRDVASLLAVFTDVGHLDRRAAALQKLEVNRLTAHFGPSLMIARWILGSDSPGLRSGNTRGFALVFEMNLLFQAFVGRLLRKVLPAGLRLRQEAPQLYLATDQEQTPAFLMKPDFTVLRASEVVCLADTKWKQLDGKGRRRGIQQSDVYQLHTYSQAYASLHVGLWYPFSSKLEGVDRPTYNFLRLGKSPTGACLRVDWIDLGVDLPPTAWVAELETQVAAALEMLGVVAQPVG
ncbi:McrC family protein [Ramlibacter solisilvae]|uniref:Restriction endonuclease n=1 Tax=Ramlibacter tataouinensis TaxID=94132 RepID=A0A127JVA0_9BURK|nr:hypothetical protein [Ramlibacter tataouinensis]AMO23910.1 hypothetical protein UC35_14875 [Ramlibacter tataouinensis]